MSTCIVDGEQTGISLRDIAGGMNLALGTPQHMPLEKRPSDKDIYISILDQDTNKVVRVKADVVTHHDNKVEIRGFLPNLDDLAENALTLAFDYMRKHAHVDPNKDYWEQWHCEDWWERAKANLSMYAAEARQAGHSSTGTLKVENSDHA